MSTIREGSLQPGILVSDGKSNAMGMHCMLCLAHLSKQQQSAELRGMLPHEPREVGVPLDVAFIANCARASTLLKLRGMTARWMRCTALHWAHGSAEYAHGTCQQAAAPGSDAAP